MSGMFGGKTPQAKKPTPVNALQVQTSVYGTPVALIYGRNRVAGQMIDYVGFRSIEVKQKQQSGGKGGGGKANTTSSYTYRVTFALALGEGQLNAVNNVWRENERMSLAAAGLTFFNGSPTQTAWSYMTTKFPTHALAYANTAYIAGADYNLGDSPSIQNFNFDVSGIGYEAGAGKEGAKPSVILTDYLTNDNHGAGFNFLGTLADWQAYCLARGIFLSPIEDTQRPASAFVDELAKITNSAVVWSQNKLTLVPYGDEPITGAFGSYTPSLVPLYDITEHDYLAKRGEGYVEVDRRELELSYNHIQIECRDKANDYLITVVEAKDQADIDRRGLRSKAILKYHSITDPAMGRDIAQLILQRELYVRRSFTFALTVRHSLLELMDLLTINDPVNELQQQLVRITSIEETDDGIEIEAEEVLANASSAPLYTTQNPQGFLPDFGVAPGTTETVLINAPGLLTDSGYELWIAGRGASDNWGGAQVWVSEDNVNYREVGYLSQPSRMGTLQSTLAAASSPLDNTNTLTVNLIGGGEMLSGTDADRDQLRTLMYLENNGGEFLSYKTATLVSALRYNLTSMQRGCYGTNYNASRAAASKWARIDDAIFRLPYGVGQVNTTLYVKLLAYNKFGAAIQSLADVTASSIVLKPNTSQAPVRLNELGGSGVNIMPDKYSTFENPTLPTFTNPGSLTLSRSTVQKAVAASVGILQTGSLYFGPSISGSGLKLQPGRKYLVSFFAQKSYAGGTFRLAIETLGGTYYYTPTFTTVNDQVTRYTATLDLSANTQTDAWVVMQNMNTGILYVDGIMVEEAIGTSNVASNYVRGYAGDVALSALITALDARAIADGQVDIYRQATAPAIGGAGAKLGDYWQDSDDGKWYYCNGSSWVESTDSRLPQAIVDASNAQSSANTAQTTANARIRLFVQDATPSAGSFIVGDMWYRPGYKDTYYWNGAGWSKNQDSFAAVSDALVFNPSFEQADLYWNRDTGMYAETNAEALSGTNIMVFSAALGNPNARAVNNRSIPVRPGQVLSVIANIGRWQNVANGESAAGLVFYDKDGGYVGERNIAWSTAAATGQKAQAYWRTVTGKITVPYGAVKAYANIITTGCTSGFWVYDNVRVAFHDNEPRAVTSGENFVANSNFGQNKGQFPFTQYTPVAGEFVADGWVIDGLAGSYVGAGVATGLEFYGSGNGQNQLFIGDAGGTASPGSNHCYVRGADRFAVEPGEKFVVRSEGVVDIGTPKPSGIDVFTYVGVNFYNNNGGDVGYGGRAVANYAGYWLTEDVITIPAGVAYVRPIVGVQWNNTTGANVTMPWATSHVRFRQCNIRRQTTLDQTVITDGTTYGRTGNVDLVVDSGVRRIGVNVKGSRKILGGARNSRASIVYGAAAVRTATALTANSSGQVTVNAHNVEISGETVTYNAVTNAVTGLTQGVTYVIFTLDPFLDGGTRTYYAQTSVLNAQQAGEGAVFIGNITIPTSGSGSGGGGGIGNPGDWCVDYDTVLPDGRFLRDVGLGELVQCIDVTTGEVTMQPLLGMRFGEEECYRIATPELASVVQSKSTPMDLPDGRVLTTPEMFGKPVYVNINGESRLSFVSDLQYLGIRRVIKPDFGNRMFFAGERAEAAVATHNAQYKP